MNLRQNINQLINRQCCMTISIRSKNTDSKKYNNKSTEKQAKYLCFAQLAYCKKSVKFNKNMCAVIKGF